MFLGKRFFVIYNLSPHFSYANFSISQTEKESLMAKAAKVSTVKVTNTTKTPCAAKGACDKMIDFKFYAPLAKKVELGGCFNGWKADKNPLKKDATGNWKVSLKLKPGRYQYRYLVDGVWQNAQEPVECVPNAFGSWNCVVEVAK